MERFKRLFQELHDTADRLELDFVAAYKVDGVNGSMAFCGDSPVFEGAATLIDSDNSSLEDLQTTANALNAYILERREVVTH